VACYLQASDFVDSEKVQVDDEKEKEAENAQIQK
jgi:hypothetical protein